MKLNEHVLSGVVILAATILAFFAGQASYDSLQILTVKIMNVALLLGVSSGFLKLLKGTKYDVVSEIFDQHNIAASIFTVGFVCAMALAITVNS